MVPVLREGSRQDRDAEGQEVGIAGTKPMTLLRDSVARGTQDQRNQAWNPHST